MGINAQAQPKQVVAEIVCQEKSSKNLLFSETRTEIVPLCFCHEYPDTTVVTQTDSLNNVGTFLASNEDQGVVIVLEGTFLWTLSAEVGGD